MSDPTVPERFVTFNEQQSKDLSVIIQIDGLADIISSAPVGTRLRYGDAGIKYGQAGLKYGGLRPYTNTGGGTFRDYINLDQSSLTMSQKLEQEQGRASISQMSIALLDKDGWISQLFSPGVILPEIMGRDVKVYLGFQDISFPDDFWLIFRGRIQSFTTKNSLFIVNLGDPNLRRRKSLFFTGTTKLNSSITDTDQVIPVVSNGDFFNQILGPDGMVDPGVKTYIKIDDEYIEYNRQAFGTNEFTNVPVGAVVTRGARGTIAEAHDIDSDVIASVELSGNPMDLALKTMLSGWAGPYKSSIPIQHLVYTGDPMNMIPNGIILEDDTDAVQDLGIAVGDYITVTGDPDVFNNKTVIVTGFEDNGSRTNRIILCDTIFNASPTTPAVFSVRSQYDTWPVGCGVKMYGWEVDVAQHQDLKQRFLAQEAMRIFMQGQENSAKSYIEREFYLPIGYYSLTRFGKLSVKKTGPAIADQRLAVLTQDNIISPVEMSQERSLTNRNFFNEVDFSYDPNDAGAYRSTLRVLDAESLEDFEVLSVLPISSNGLRPDLTPESLIESKALAFLNRYKRAALLVKIKVNMRIGATSEVGDIVILQDNGNLMLTNFSDGTRNSGSVLYEIKEKSYDIKKGVVSLTLIGNVGFFVGDNFATWAPSSNVSATGSTPALVRIVPSYGALYGAQEYKKWQDYIGLNIFVHNYDYSQAEEVRLLGLDPTDRNNLIVSPSLSFTPDDTHIVDLANYSTSSDPKDQEIAKQVHCFWDRAAPVTSGVSATQFNVGPSDAALLFTDAVIYLRKADTYSPMSPEVKVISVAGTLVTVESLGFTPDNTFFVELVPFQDGRPAYRWY